MSLLLTGAQPLPLIDSVCPLSLPESSWSLSNFLFEPLPVSFSITPNPLLNGIQGPFLPHPEQRAKRRMPWRRPFQCAGIPRELG